MDHVLEMVEVFSFANVEEFRCQFYSLGFWCLIKTHQMVSEQSELFVFHLKKMLNCHLFWHKNMQKCPS